MIEIVVKAKVFKLIKRIVLIALVVLILGGSSLIWYANTKADDALQDLAGLLEQAGTNTDGDWASIGVPFKSRHFPDGSSFSPYLLGDYNKIFDEKNQTSDIQIPDQLPYQIAVDPGDKSTVLRIILSRLDSTDIKSLIGMSRGELTQEKKNAALKVLRGKLTSEEYQTVIAIAIKYKSQLQNKN